MNTDEIFNRVCRENAEFKAAAAQPLSVKLATLRDEALDTLEKQFSRHGLDTLSLYGQPDRPMVRLGDGQMAQVCYVVDGERVILDVATETYTYQVAACLLQTDELIRLVSYVSKIEQLYHDTPGEENYRKDKVFLKQRARPYYA
jgi:hypothetical protein